MKKRPLCEENRRFYVQVARAIRWLARDARKIARMHGTRIYVSENGKVVASGLDRADRLPMLSPDRGIS
jgi:hypothetical protein